MNKITFLFGGSDIFRAIGDPNQISPFIILALYIIYRIFKYNKKKRQQDEFLRKKQQETLAESQKLQAQKAQEEKFQAEAEEKARKEAEYQKVLRESYFLETQIDAGDITPHTLKDIQQLIDQGELSLSSKIKFGYNTTNFNEIQTFKEFTGKFNSFM